MNGGEFRAWRERLRFTLEQVAFKLGVSRRDITAWEADEAPISQQTKLAVWAIEHTAELERQLGRLQAGEMTIREKRPRGGTVVDVDTTAEMIDRLRSQLAALDYIVSEHQADHRQQR